MSVGPMGAAGGFAGTPLAQTHGSEAERIAQQARAHERRIQSEMKAADAAGIAATDSDESQTHERDADGRRLWEQPPQGGGEQDAPNDESVLTDERLADPADESGSQLDLTG